MISRGRVFAPATDALIRFARQLCVRVSELQFAAPVTHVYNPLHYAWCAHEAYLSRYGFGPKRVIFLGMNPGPFGMVQTGVPFGEIAAVREWLRIEAAIEKPPLAHPKRPVTGFGCPRTEISGRRLWGLFARRFGTTERFFSQHIVINYCPLAFLESTGRNRTPDKLPGHEKTALFAACDEHLRAVVEILEPEWVIGIGDFATRRAREVFPDGSPRIGRILHPSPASPAANRNWAALAEGQLQQLGIWS